MVTMLLDHIGYLYDISALRYAGRLAMPLYSILFVVTIQKNQITLRRILLLGLLAQVPYLYIFQLPHLNIIFGFAIFAWTVDAIKQRHWAKIVVGFLMMWIPVSYGWYLYFTLGTFCWLKNKYIQRGFFAVLTVVYICLEHIHARQLLAACVPFLTKLKAPRPNKYLYRYFYPGHLLILAVLHYLMIGTFTLPFGDRYETEYYDDIDDYYYEYYIDSPPDYFYDTGVATEPNETAE